MAYRGPPAQRSYDEENLAGLRMEGREPGTRRKKIAGYLKAANGLRQSYVQGWNERSANYPADGTPGAFPDAAMVSNGDAEMLIFPSYARKHTKSAPQAVPGTIQEASGAGRDSRDTIGAGDAEFWRSQWEKHENDNAVVDVDVRGWLFTPHKGQMNRKQRLMVALARQLVGLPATATKAPSSQSSSRSSSPVRGRHNLEEEQAQREAAAIIRKGQTEAEIAGQGGFSETPSKDSDGDSIYDRHSPLGSPFTRPRDDPEISRLRRTQTSDSLSSMDSEHISPVHRRSSWPTPANMTAAELATANGNLMTRLKPFMVNPMGGTNISAFFYNETMSRQRTVTTDPSGHFNFRAALDFVPTHVRILGTDKLSVQEEVRIIDPRGVSLVSDIDDTVRHSAITRGAREIFRNAFIRELGDLTVEGVREWYGELSDMGVQLHYVSNSPWQLYPVITSFFDLAGLPKGSFHLKQYSGMLQGIFEPVAERKKATLDRIMRDFPERRFILVGDSGEADLEVYTDVVMDHPGRVIAIFIRDVTTPPSRGFFDPSNGPPSAQGMRTPRSGLSRSESEYSLASAKRFSRPGDIQDDDHELRAAIAASLKDMEDQAASDRRRVFGEYGRTSQPVSPESARRPVLPPRRPTEPPASKAQQATAPEEDLIDFSDDVTPKPKQDAFKPPPPLSSASHDLEMLRQQETGSRNNVPSLRPAPPSKPSRLRSPSNASTVTLKSLAESTVPLKPAPPPKPRKPSTSIRPVSPSPLHQAQTVSPEATSRPPLPDRQSYRTVAKQKLSAAYNAIPSATGFFGQTQYSPTYSPDQGLTHSPRSLSLAEGSGETMVTNGRATLLPPPPPRRGVSTYPGQTKRSSGNWGGNDGYGSSEGGTPQPVNKKEELWKRRWLRAKEVMAKEGVMLRTWRVGSDVMDECVRSVEKELQQMKRPKPPQSRTTSGTPRRDGGKN